ncbi:hypothetical protein BASA81_000985 [Batrachochytrium salamandrivorans]|nr:hypothetical protein BASA81_000985 [Batrachochytrium salamandrivorans]
MSAQPPLPKRLDVHSLDPRSMFPTPENIALVAHHARLVQVQLEQDRVLVKLAQSSPSSPASAASSPTSSSEESRMAKELRNQTLNYLSLLNDWLAQANMVATRQQQQQQQQQQAPGPALQLARAAISSNNQVVMDPCAMGEFACQISPNQVAQVKCLVDQTKQRYYCLVKTLRGTIYGNVQLYQIGRMEANGVVRFPHPSEQVAIKCFNKDLVRRRKSRDGFNVQEDPMRELAIQQRLSQVGHAFVMPLLACLETDREFYAILPYVGGGELFEFVAARAPLPEVEARKLFRNILDGVYYCHCAGVCHRDISLENFLLGGPTASDPLLIDFGLSVIMEPNGNGWRPIPHTGPVGKVFYMAPEVYDLNSQPVGSLANGLDGTKVDVWSLGVCLAIMLTGVPLWECASQIDDRFRASIIRRELPRVLRLWGFELSPQVTNLLQRMLEFKPADRLSIPEIAQHEWFTL